MTRLAALSALCLLIFLAAAYWWQGIGLRPLDDGARAELQRRDLAHQFVRLSLGEVHYRLEGPTDGETVLLIHGFAGPMFVWDDVIPRLTTAGYRVLAFDGYGRGFSSRPDAVYDENLMDLEILELLDRLAVRRKLHVVGYSAGGVSAVVFTARHPEAVATLSLIAPGGLASSRPFPSWLFGVPAVSQWFSRVVAPGLFQRFFAKTVVALPNADRLKMLAEQQFHFAGAGDALTSMALHYPITGAEAHYTAAARQNIPIFLLWGELDTTAPIALSQIARRLIPEAKFLQVSNADHNLPYANPALVSEQLSIFFAEAGRRTE